jgi:hypothetical protein
MQKQIKSKKRVADHGEVFTNEREVNAMLDLVKSETERIDSRFLEPACGNGNFLIEILRRKIEVVKSKYKKSQHEWERYSVVALSSCYGVDILEDNCIECRARLFDFFKKEYAELYRKTTRQEVLNVVGFILSKNIVCGDALTLKQTNGDPIVFAEWNAINGTKMKRRDFTLANLLETESYYAKNSENQDTFFSMLREQGTDLITPKSVGEFPVIDFDKLDTQEIKENTK